MKRNLHIGIVLLVLALMATACAEQATESPVASTEVDLAAAEEAIKAVVQGSDAGSPRGYVLKAGEGEVVGRGLVKASSGSGTRSVEVVMSELPAGAYTGIHIHTNADEFFYILEGSGTIQIDGVTYALEPGDFAFIPIGVEHEVTTESGIALMEIVDGPARVEFMREVAARPSSNRMSLEECNEIGARHGVICITN